MIAMIQSKFYKSLSIFSLLTYLSISPANAHETLQDYLAKHHLKMELVGDGRDTLNCTLVLTDPKTGHTICTDLKTFCVSKKHLLPPAAQYDVLKDKLTYTLSPYKNPDLMKIVEAAKRLDAEGKFNNLPISNTRRINTISQLSIWQKMGGKGPSADGINLKSIEKDVLNKVSTSTQTLSVKEKSILRQRLDAICDAIEKTRKTADSIQSENNSTNGSGNGSSTNVPPGKSEQVLLSSGSILVPSNTEIYQNMMISQDALITVPYLKIAALPKLKEKELIVPEPTPEDEDGDKPKEDCPGGGHEDGPGADTPNGPPPQTIPINCPPPDECPIGVLLESRDETFIPENGNDTWVTAQIYEKQGENWVKSAKTDTLTFDFYNGHVSNEKGECLNSGDQTTIDLFFDQKLNPDFNCGQSEDGHPASATTKNEVNNTKVKLKCEDWGAYSQVEVKGKKSIQLARYGGLVTDKIKNPEDVSKTVPPDESPVAQGWDARNHISDAYEKKEGMSPDAKLDDETNPESNPEKPGDGYSAYEEYRGFRIMGEKDKPSPHIRTSWKKKELFDFNPDSIDLSNYETATGIKLYRVTSGQFKFDTEVPESKKNVPEEGSSILINFNKGFANLVDQHGVSIKYGSLVSSIKLSPEQEKQFGTVGTLAKTPRLENISGVMGPPKNHSCIIVDKNNIGRLFEINKSDFGDLTAEGSIRKYASHEFSHASCLIHHGEFGKKPKKDADGFEVYDQNGNQIMTTDFGNEEEKPGSLVIPKGGVSSGNWDCLLRYKAWKSSVVKKDDGSYEDVDTRLGAMNSLCTSAAGTGANAGGAKAGNATKGDCRHQLNVSDFWEGTH